MIITIELNVPDGTEVNISHVDQEDAAAPVAPDADQVERYFRHYLSDHGRKLYGAAALLEDHRGPGYTLSDVAKSLSIDYPRAQSFHRTSGRSARRWRDDTGTDAPIRLLDMSYDWVEDENGMRTRYQFPPGVPKIIKRLDYSAG